MYCCFASGQEAAFEGIRVVLVVGFESSDQGIKGFRIVFSDIKFNTGSIESKHLCKGAVNSLTAGKRIF